jgi:hypothetical protein
MANVNKANVSDTEPVARQSERSRLVLTRRGKNKKESFPAFLKDSGLEVSLKWRM